MSSASAVQSSAPSESTYSHPTQSAGGGGGKPFPPALVGLVDWPRWIGWRWKRIEGRDPAKREGWAKVAMPVGGGTLRRREAGAVEKGWAGLREAMAVVTGEGARAAGVGGVGWVPVGEDGLVFIDLDGCRDPVTGVVSEAARGVIEACGSYAEVSPSGTGVRIIGGSEGWGGADKGRFKWLGMDGSIELAGEVYFNFGYVTVTLGWLDGYGDRWGKGVGGVAQALVDDDANEAWRARERTARGGNGVLDPGRDREAPIEVVRALLAWIPNEGGADWDWWVSEVGLAVWGATGGSEEGLRVWDEWSRRCRDWVEGSCEEAWWRIGGSPPDGVGWGKLEILGRGVVEGSGGKWQPGPVVEGWKEAQSARKRADRVWGVLSRLEGGGRLPRIAGADSSLIVVWGGAGAESTMVSENGGGGGNEGKGDWSRPGINIHDELHVIADQAENALIGSGLPVFMRDRGLVMPAIAEVMASDNRQTTAVGLREIEAGAAMDLMSQSAVWYQMNPKTGMRILKHPPRDVAQVLMQRGGRRPFPVVAGVTSTPTLRRDGSVLEAEGYDAGTHLYMVRDKGLAMPVGWGEAGGTGEGRGRERAAMSLAALDGLLDGFPFVDRLDRAVALSALLTAMTRGAYGVAPLHAFRAPMPGTGKSYLVDVISTIVTGRPCPVAAAAIKEDETEKRIVGLLLGGFPLVSVDNINGIFRSDILCQAVEKQVLRIRALGGSKILEVENQATFFINGNGLRPSGDLVRRTLTCRLDAQVERPEARSFSFDPVKAALTDRGRYVAAALDVGRTFIREGRPGLTGIKPFISYDEWSGVVRGALVWLGWPDVSESIEAAREDDPDIGNLKEVLTALLRVFGAGREITAREMIEAMAPDSMIAMMLGSPSVADREKASANADFRDVLMRVAGERGAVNTQKLGMWLSRHDGRIANGMRLKKEKSPRNVVAWGIERITDLKLVK